MQVRQLLAAALLSVTAVGAMSQEVDPRDQHQAFTSTRTRESVQAEVRNLQSQGQLSTVGEFAQAPVTGSAVAGQYAEAAKSRDQVKAELAAWRASHKARVGELG